MRALLAILTMVGLLSMAFHGAINSEENHRNPSRFFFGREVQNLPIDTTRIIKDLFGDLHVKNGGKMNLKTIFDINLVDVGARKKEIRIILHTYRNGLGEEGLPS